MKQINFKGLDWYVLEETNDIAKLLLKDVLDEDRIKQYCEDDKYRNGNEVRHSFNLYPPFDWNKSYIKNVVLNNFKKYLELGREAKLTLLTKEEVEALPEEVRKCNDWYWTKSNASDENDSYAYAWSVFSSGFVYYDGVYDASSVRPVLYLPSNLITSGDTGQMACNEKLDIEEIEIRHIEDTEHYEIKEKINELIKVINKLKKEGK